MWRNWKLEISSTVAENRKRCNPLEDSLALIQWLNIELLGNPEESTRKDINHIIKKRCLDKNLSTNVHSNNVHNSLLVETTQSLSHDEWINKMWHILTKD